MYLHIDIYVYAYIYTYLYLYTHIYLFIAHINTNDAYLLMSLAHQFPRIYAYKAYQHS